MANKYYNFHYTPDEGKLPGLTMERQTEDALNDIGEKSYIAYETVAALGDDVTTAVKTMAEVKQAAENAQTAADKAQETADTALETAADNAGNLGGLEARVKTNEGNISTLQNDVGALKTKADENAANIDTLIEDVDAAGSDISALGVRVSANEGNIDVLMDNVSVIMNYEPFEADEENLGADEQTSYGNYRMAAGADTGLPDTEGTFLLTTIPVSGEDENVVYQTAINEETGVAYCRKGVTTGTGDETVTAWTDWISPTADLQEAMAAAEKRLDTAEADIDSNTENIAENKTAIDAHLADYNNPHKVTAEQLGLASAYTYKGSVSTYADLPAEDLKNGDVYNIETEDEGKGIPAGGNVAWNGEGWDLIGGDLSQVMKDIDSLQAAVAETVTDITASDNVLSVTKNGVTSELTVDNVETAGRVGNALTVYNQAYNGSEAVSIAPVMTVNDTAPDENGNVDIGSDGLTEEEADGLYLAKEGAAAKVANALTIAGASYDGSAAVEITPVMTVNGTAPDENGNVVLEAGSGTITSISEADIDSLFE